ncbi:glycoside hydrolase family 18 protein [Plicaturopsis crispa FD-325 SS-3]|nr:glycoside hydrolase family 18 protein [Plicaturopsis crispa FD-325 SS-3]
MVSASVRLPFISRVIPFFFAFIVAASGVNAYDNSRNDNLAVYWGQDSAGNQQTLQYYCADDTINAFPLAFLYIFFGEGGAPVIDFANTCNQYDNSTFPGTDLANCQGLADDIEACQAKGNIVTLSIGGGTGQVGFANDTQATDFAVQIWDLFLGGSSSTRPFGSAVLDGVDLDIESGSPAHYATFVTKIQSLAEGASKKYYITAAPQCPFPDASIGAALNAAPFDAVYVQFYNNYCGLDQPSDFNFDTWDDWAKNTSPNPDVKVFIGAAASANAAGEGYVNASSIENYITETQSKYSSFGGVMLWDASEAYTNNRYDKAVKNTLTAGSSKAKPKPKSSSTASSKASSTAKPRASSTAKPRASSTGTSRPAPTTSDAFPAPESPNHHFAIPKYTEKDTQIERTGPGLRVNPNANRRRPRSPMFRGL